MSAPFYVCEKLTVQQFTAVVSTISRYYIRLFCRRTFRHSRWESSISCTEQYLPHNY